MGDIASAAIGGGSGLIGSWISSRAAKRNTDKTIAANKAMAEYAYSKDLEMWNRANEYNLPANQMQRLKEGGINPMMAFGGGSVGGNVVQSSLPKYQAPRQEYNYLPPVDIGSAIQAFQDMRVKNAQVDYIKEQERLAKSKRIGQAITNDINTERRTWKESIIQNEVFGGKMKNQNLLNQYYKGYYELFGDVGKPGTIEQPSYDKLQDKWKWTMPNFNRDAPWIKKWQLTNDLLDYQNQTKAKEVEYWMWKNMYFPGAKIGVDALGNISRLIGSFMPKVRYSGNAQSGMGMKNIRPKTSPYNTPAMKNYTPSW